MSHCARWPSSFLFFFVIIFYLCLSWPVAICLTVQGGHHLFYFFCHCFLSLLKLASGHMSHCTRWLSSFLFFFHYFLSLLKLASGHMSHCKRWLSSFLFFFII